MLERMTPLQQEVDIRDDMEADMREVDTWGLTWVGADRRLTWGLT